MAPMTNERRILGAKILGMRLFDLDAQEYRSLPNGTRVEYRCGVYAGDYLKSNGRWFGEDGPATPPGGSVIVSIPGVVPVAQVASAPAPTADDRERREALERIASGTSGASPSEVATAKRVLGGAS